MEKHPTDLKSDRLGIKTILHTIMGIVILLVGNILASLPFDLYYLITNSEVSSLAAVARPIMSIAIIFLLTNLYIVKILKMPLDHFRICKPKNIAVWIICAVALPLFISGFYIFLTPGTFAASDLSSEQVILRVVNAVFGACLVAGITEELIFRGFIMHLLESRWNKHIAIIAPSVLFGLLHIFNMENPNIIDILMLIIAGTGVGIMFSIIAYQSGSIWPGAVVHGIWNLIIIGGILEISIEPGRSIFTYTLKSNSTLLTGGAFGIESSLPAIIGYVIVIILAWRLQRRKSAN